MFILVPIGKGVTNFRKKEIPMNRHSRGQATGGSVAAAEALRLWARCAVGGADYSMLPGNDATLYVRLKAAEAGFDAAVAAMTENWDAERVPELQERWQEGARKALENAAGRLLKACREIEHGNSSDANFCTHLLGGEFEFKWNGYVTKGRFLEVHLFFNTVPGQLMVVMRWDTATGEESTYLGLPSMTDEADWRTTPRPGGWTSRN